mgnify:CR=1 FL=1
MSRYAAQNLQAKEEAIFNVQKRLKDLPFLVLEGRTQEQEAAERKSLKVCSDVCNGVKIASPTLPLLPLFSLRYWIISDVGIFRGGAGEIKSRAQGEQTDENGP